MKQLKIAIVFFGILGGFTLNGCIDSGTGNTAASGPGNTNVSNAGNANVSNVIKNPGSNNINSASVSNDKNASDISNHVGSDSSNLQLTTPEATTSQDHGLQKKITPMLNSFNLYESQAGIATVSAGEIIGESITLQLPPDTKAGVASPFTLTFTGTYDTILKDGVPVNNKSEIVVLPQTSAKFTVIKNNVSKDYLASFVLKPYFKPYNDDPSNECLQDLDGNVWTKSSPDSGTSGDTWPGYMYILKSFSACGIPAGKWQLPSLEQVKSFLDRLPSAYRSPPDGPGNLEPTDWFNMPQNGFRLIPGRNYWISKRSKENAYVMSISKQNIFKALQSSMMYPLPVSNGPKAMAKTITSFRFTPENSTPLEGKIIGNQVFVNIPLWVNPGSTLHAVTTFSITGGTVSLNGMQLTNNSNISYNIEQPIPITITAQNGDKNIYTLLIKSTKVMPPVIKPAVPGLITVCTSASTIDPAKTFNRTVIATLGIDFYKQDTLPLPGTCKEINLGKDIKDLAANNVLWWSFTNETPIGSTLYVDSNNYYHDIIPKFKWVPDSSDPSGFKLSVTTDATCYRDSQYQSGVTPDCLN
ncbi:MAG: hypothetical protein K0R14_283 [Burkholderiales bacterium]|jgi:hypothetical protein|nr:hypothetical protein [Burkholderiales bacterium]